MVERRTHTCGELRVDHEGRKVVVQGWAHAVRDRGSMVFLVLRDRHGQIQVVADDRHPEVRDAAKAVRQEFVVQVKGVVNRREPSMINAKMETGQIEILAEEVEILS